MLKQDLNSNNNIEEKNDTLLSLLFSKKDTSFSNSDLTIARDLVANYFAKGKMEGENFKKLLESSNSYKAMVGASTTSGASGAIISNVTNPQAMSSTIGSGIGGVVAGPLGGVVGSAIGHTVGGIPGVQVAAHTLMSSMSGFLIGSSVYLLQVTRSKWVNIDKFKKFMDSDLFSWQNEYFRKHSLKIQAAVEILTNYLINKLNGRFSNLKILRISWQDADSGFYLINSYVKILLMMLQNFDRMPASFIYTLFNIIENELTMGVKENKIPNDFIDIFNKFKEKIKEHIAYRVNNETIVENLGNVIASGASATVPIIPWIYCCILRDEQSISFYDPESFNKKIKEDVLNSVSYKFWTDLSFFKVNEIKNYNALQQEISEKKIGRINALIKDLNKERLSSKRIQEIPSEFELSKTEKKLNKLFEYANEFLKYNYNTKDKNLKKIAILSDKLIKLEPPQYSSTTFPQKTWNKIYEWWSSENEIQNKLSNMSFNIRIFKSTNSVQKVLTKEEFKNVVLLAFEIKKEFDNNKLSFKFENGDASKNSAIQFAHKIDSFCELLRLADKIEEFLSDEKNNDKFSIYSLFGLWSVYNVILDKYSSNIPEEVFSLYQNKKLVNNINSTDSLKKYFIIPYESFSKLLIPGFDKEYLDKNSQDFFRMYIYYLTNIINLVSKIQYHTEALKFNKLIIAMYGEEEASSLISVAPLEVISRLITNLMKVMDDLCSHITNLQSKYENEKNNSWFNTIGLYNFFFGKETGFYKNFINRYKEYRTRLEIFKKNIEQTKLNINQKIQNKSLHSRSINESIARKTDRYFNFSLDIYLNYLKNIQSKYSNGLEENDAVKLDGHILDLRERHLLFISDAALMKGNIPQFKNLNTLASEHPINSYLMKFFDQVNYKIPKKVYEISKQSNDYTQLSHVLQNFLKSTESHSILNDCIVKIKENKSIENISFNFFQRTNFLNLLKNDIFIEKDKEVRTALFMSYFAKFNKATKVKLFSDEQKFSSIKNENLLETSGLNKIDLDFSDETNNQGIFEYFLICSCSIYEANIENILASYVEPINYSEQKNYLDSNPNKKRFLYAVWGLYGLFLAYMFYGTRESAQKLIRNLNEDKIFRKSEQAQFEAKKDPVILSEKRKILEDRKRIVEENKKLAAERLLLEQSYPTTYFELVQNVKMEINRLKGSEKGQLLQQKFDEFDKKVSIALLRELKAPLSEHRGYFAFGNTQSYKNILAIAKKLGIKESDFA
ncbi:hypothetical protein [Fluviispira sanaruensis]|uniref:Uncharacterized protein n=1 Tax=Fluviispira sanaruensis TaxID=2493639 RepID=A0A4P2VML3_FLUSA|nr:hypothetical protein [Fluviispira sanaruensis]BBH53284.1 hypothetical protein JCM31447_17270 [Fluviispira sanaruensis]